MQLISSKRSFSYFCFIATFVPKQHHLISLRFVRLFFLLLVSLPSAGVHCCRFFSFFVFCFCCIFLSCLACIFFTLVHSSFIRYPFFLVVLLTILLKVILSIGSFVWKHSVRFGFYMKIYFLLCRGIFFCLDF